MPYLLETKIVSHILRRHPRVMDKLQSLAMADLHISAITHAELMYGLAKKPDAVKLQRAVHEFLLRVAVLPFDGQAGSHYGSFKARAEAAGTSLAPLDMMIAAHASALGMVLVSSDAAFGQIAGLNLDSVVTIYKICDYPTSIHYLTLPHETTRPPPPRFNRPPMAPD